MTGKCFSTVRLTVLLLAAMFAMPALPTLAAGYFNTPCSLPQCVGCGFGPGYHAPMMLGPYYTNRSAQKPLVRLPARPCASSTPYDTYGHPHFAPVSHAPVSAPRYLHQQPGRDPLFGAPGFNDASQPSWPYVPEQSGRQNGASFDTAAPDEDANDVASPSDRDTDSSALPMPTI